MVPPRAVVKALIYISFTQLTMSTINTVGAKDLEQKEKRGERSVEIQALNCHGGVMFGSQCLRIYNNTVATWYKANELCNAEGGRLASLEHPADVRDYLSANYDNSPYFWVGGNDIANEGSWVWTDGEPIDDQFPWFFTQPDGGSSENCIIVLAQGSYHDLSCNSQQGYICEDDVCEGNEGLRGKCFGTQNDLSSYNKCDTLIKSTTGCGGQTCCIECSRLADVCESKWPGSVIRGSPCARCERKMGEARQVSGCSCCKECKGKRKCNRAKGVCISDEDPKLNRTWCASRGGKVEEEWCKGPGCYCCIYK